MLLIQAIYYALLNYSRVLPSNIVKAALLIAMPAATYIWMCLGYPGDEQLASTEPNGYSILYGLAGIIWLFCELICAVGWIIGFFNDETLISRLLKWVDEEVR